MGRGKDIRPDVIAAIRDVYQRDGLPGALSFGENLRVSASSVYRICDSRAPPRKPRQGRAPKWTSAQIQALLEHVQEEPCETLEEIRIWGDCVGYPNVTIQTICNYLDGHMVTYKTARRVPDARNSVPVKQARREYAEWFQSHPEITPIYVDETGVNLWTARRFGRAPIGGWPRLLVSSQPGANRSIAMAVCPGFGVLHGTIRANAFNAQAFELFMRDLAGIVANCQVRNPVFIMDNCRVHSRQVMATIEEETGIPTRFLPPWSPMLNPIDGVFSCFKNTIRGLVTVGYREEILEIATLPHGSRGARRGILLDRAYRVARGNLTPALIDGYCRGIARALAKSANFEDQ